MTSWSNRQLFNASICACLLSLPGVANADSASARISGSVKAINAIQELEAAEGLDLNSDGSQVTLASFSLSNNDPEGFQVKVHFENGGNLVHEGNDTQISLEGIRLEYLGGESNYTLPSESLTLVSDEGGGASLVWSPEGEQVEATRGLKVGLVADWDSTSNLPEGDYLETVTITIISGDG